jgi:hypothetical protein
VSAVEVSDYTPDDQASWHSQSAYAIRRAMSWYTQTIIAVTIIAVKHGNAPRWQRFGPQRLRQRVWILHDLSVRLDCPIAQGPNTMGSVQSNKYLERSGGSCWQQMERSPTNNGNQCERWAGNRPRRSPCTVSVLVQY